MTERLSKYFTGIAVKRLSAVEADISRSHQHEFNGVGSLRSFLGSEKKQFPARFIYLSDDDPSMIDASVTWYDAREAHPTRTEWRLYYPSNPVMDTAHEGDYLTIGMRPDGSLVIIVAKQGVTQEHQLEWLFRLPGEPGNRNFITKEIGAANDRQLGFAEKLVLSQINVEVEETANTFLDRMLREFNGNFPETSVFSSFARNTMPDADPIREPDYSLVAWLEHEEVLFRTLERHLIASKIRQGFGEDVDDFIDFSLSVQNRRKARSGRALENHMEQILISNGIKYSRGKRTEGKTVPDFIFPGIDCYHDVAFPAKRLTMLAAKSTCKDRWRQVIPEAKRIEHKHLLTLEPSISNNQTNEMKEAYVQLVVPFEIHQTYNASQRSWLMDVASFLIHVKAKEAG